MSYHGATICLNGHVISKYSEKAQVYCSQCGKETYSNCTKCHAPIRGLPEIRGAVFVGDRPYKKPYYCHECGHPYPWTQQILDNAIELIALDDSLDDVSKELIKNAIPDIIIDTPTTPVAVAKYKKGISKAGQIVKDSLYNLLIDAVSETAKKMLSQ